MSLNIVDQTTGDLTPIAGNATDKVGNLNALTTTDKSSVVAAINEVNGFFVNLGLFTANDLNTFLKSIATAFHQLNPIPRKGYSVAADWENAGRFTGILTDYIDSVDFAITGGDNKRIFCGRYLLQTDVLELKTYTCDNNAQTVVSLDPTYDAGTDWSIVKQGNICVLNMRNLKDIPIGDTVIGTIPVGFRPVWSFFEYVYVGNKDAHVGFNFDGNGGITCLNHTGSILTDVIFVNRNVTYFTA